MIPHLKITISRTSDGKAVYVQIMDPVGMMVNVVLIAERVDLLDARTRSS